MLCGALQEGFALCIDLILQALCLSVHGTGALAGLGGDAPGDGEQQTASVDPKTRSADRLLNTKIWYNN